MKKLDKNGFHEVIKMEGTDHKPRSTEPCWANQPACSQNGTDRAEQVQAVTNGHYMSFGKINQKLALGRNWAR